MEELHAKFLALADKTATYDFVAADHDVLRSAVDAHFEDVDASSIPCVDGHVHSIESLSALDGPGLRWVMFTQGCRYRCKFCSNPDSWEVCGGARMTSKEVAGMIARTLPYLRHGRGGVTATGGDPMLQPEFVSAVFQECRRMGVPTAIDTTGMGSPSRWRKLLPHTDLVMLCVKAPKPELYEWITGGFRQENMLTFAATVDHMRIPMWIRHVLIPGLTDSDYDADWLAQFCQDHPHCMQTIDVLPYHTFGVHKWEALGLEYPLEGQRSPSVNDVRIFLDKVRSRVQTLGVSVIGGAGAVVE